MIEIKNLTLQRGSKILLDNATATINPRQRVGLIGKNGTGKSSLFALIKGEIGQDKGDLLLPKTWKLAAVAQGQTPPKKPPRWTRPRWIMYCKAMPNYSIFRLP